MKSDTVNPIPPNTDTAASDFQVVRVGIGTIFSLMTSHDERKIPRNFPHQQTHENSQTDTREERGELETREHNAGIGKGKERNDKIVDDGVQRIFQILQRADDLIRGRLDALQAVDLLFREHNRAVAVFELFLRKIGNLLAYRADKVRGCQHRLGWNTEGDQYPRNGGVNARIEEQEPHDTAQCKVEEFAVYAGPSAYP